MNLPLEVTFITSRTSASGHRIEVRDHGRVVILTADASDADMDEVLEHLKSSGLGSTEAAIMLATAALSAAR